MCRELVIEVNHVSYSYGRSNPALEDVCLELGQGDFACLIGPNGGGKTTLLRLMLGLLTPDVGDIRVFGRSPIESRHRIGYLPQHSHQDLRFPICLRDVVLMGRAGHPTPIGPYGRQSKQEVDRALEIVGLYDIRFHSFSELSGGQRRRVLIARALACKPDLLMLDEPTSDLDVAFQNELYELLFELNERMSVVMVSHDVAFVSKYVKTVVCVNRSVEVHAAPEIAGDFISELYGFGRDMRLIMHKHSEE